MAIEAACLNSSFLIISYSQSVPSGEHGVNKAFFNKKLIHVHVMLKVMTTITGNCSQTNQDCREKVPA